MELKTYNQYITESDNYVKDIEDLILTLDVSNVELAQQLLAGQQIELSELFKGDLAKFCNDYDTTLVEYFTNISKSFLPVGVINLEILGNTIIMEFQNQTVTHIPTIFLQQLKLNRNYESVNIHIKDCIINLINPNLKSIDLIKFEGSSITGDKLYCNDVYVENCKVDILTKLYATNLSLYNVRGLESLTVIQSKMLNTLGIASCNELDNLIGCPLVKTEIYLQYLTLNSFEGISEPTEYTFDHLHVKKLNGLPKSINKLSFGKIQSGNQFDLEDVTRDDFNELYSIKKLVKF